MEKTERGIRRIGEREKSEEKANRREERKEANKKKSEREEEKYRMDGGEELTSECFLC